MKCQISWINEKCEPTPDNNESIGTVHRVAYRSHNVNGSAYGCVDFSKTEEFHICEEHAKRLSDPGMSHWVFTPLADSTEVK